MGLYKNSAKLLASMALDEATDFNCENLESLTSKINVNDLLSQMNSVLSGKIAVTLESAVNLHRVNDNWCCVEAGELSKYMMSTNTRSFKKAIKNIAEEYKWDPRRIAIAVDESEIREIIDDAKNASTCTNKRFAERKMNESRAIQKVLEIMQESGIKIIKIIDK